MRDEKTKKSRRNLLKSIAAGGGAIVAGKTLPESWSRPVVDSVLLPAHAQTSASSYSGSGIIGGSTSASLTDMERLMAGVTDSLIADANAGNGGNRNGYYACAMVNGNNVFVSSAGLGGEVPANETQMIRRGTLDLNGARGTITAAGADLSPCGDFSPGATTRPAWIDSYNNNELVLHILTRCGESEGNGCSVPVLVLRIPRSDTGCVPEPAVYDGCTRR